MGIFYGRPRGGSTGGTGGTGVGVLNGEVSVYTGLPPVTEDNHNEVWLVKTSGGINKYIANILNTNYRSPGLYRAVWDSTTLTGEWIKLSGDGQVLLTRNDITTDVNSNNNRNIPTSSVTNTIYQNNVTTVTYETNNSINITNRAGTSLNVKLPLYAYKDLWGFEQSLEDTTFFYDVFRYNTYIIIRRNHRTDDSVDTSYIYTNNTNSNINYTLSQITALYSSNTNYSSITAVLDYIRTLF